MTPEEYQRTVMMEEALRSNTRPQPAASNAPVGQRAQGIVGAIGGLLGGIGRAVGPGLQQASRAIYGDDEMTRLRRQNAFQAMTLNPNQALIAANQKQMEYLQAQDLIESQANRTAQWFRGMGTDLGNKYANYLEQNPSADVTNVLKMWNDERQDMSSETETIRTRIAEAQALGFTPGSTEYNRYIAEGQGSRLSRDEKVSTENNLRTNFRQDLNQFDFFTVRDGFETVKEFYDNPGEVSDYALTVAFLKVLDPGSVVRGEEVTALNRAQALLPAFGAQLENALFGSGQLSDTVRNEIAKLSMNRYGIAARNAESLFDEYKDMADRYNLDIENIAINAYIPDPSINIRPPQIRQSSQALVLPSENELDMGLSDMNYYDLMTAWPTLTDQGKTAILNRLKK